MGKVTPNDALFATVNVYDPDGGKQHVEIYIRIETGPEGAKVGLAVDASKSMMPSFAANIPAIFRKPGQNVMEPVVKHLTAFLRGFSGDGKVNLIYWAVGTGGSEIEPIGVIDETSESSLQIEGPKNKQWGPGTKLAPPLLYYADQMKDANWALVLFVTDGEVEDLEDVKKVSLELGKQISNGTRGYLKLVVVGVGEEVNQSQLEELNDMFEGSGLNDAEGESIDMWDYSLAAEMSTLWDVVKEVDFGVELPSSCRVTTDKGVEVCSYPDTTPMKLSFHVPVGTKSVTVDIAGQQITQLLA